jgi:hypothetical protein
MACFEDILFEIVIDKVITNDTMLIILTRDWRVAAS